MDLLICESSMRQSTFKILDTMGFVEVTLIVHMLVFVVQQSRLSSSHVGFI